MTGARAADKRRRLLRDSSAIFTIRMLPAFAAAAINILFTNTLSRELNGVYQSLWVYNAVLLAIGILGLPSLMLTHTSERVHSWLAGVGRKEKALFSLWLCGLALLFIAIFPQQVFPAGIFILLFVGQAVLLLTETYLIINRRFWVALLCSLVFSLLFCALHLLFVYSYISFAWLIGGIALLIWLRAIALSIGAQQIFRRQAALLPAEPMPRAIQKQWLHLGVYDISQIIFRWIDKAIIFQLVGPALFSIYFIGTTDVPFIGMMLGAAGSTLLQQMATTEGSREERLKLVNFSGAILARVVFPLFFFLFFFRYEFIQIVFSKAYLPSVPLFAISVMTLLLRCYNFTSILQHLNRVKTINWGALLDLCIALGLAYPLFLWKGLMGVAFAFMISTYIQASFYLFKTARALRCPVLRLIPWKDWLVMLIVFGSLAIGLHEVLARFCSIKQSLLLGFIGTVAIIGTALAPVVFTKKAHG
jgi:O-antigen/teichoic acid export membrane protein